LVVEIASITLLRIDVLRQRHLHQDAVDGRVGVQGGDAVQQGRFRQVGLVFFQHRVEADVAAGLDLVAHVDVAGRVFADQDHGQAGLLAGGGEFGGAGGDFGAQLLGKLDSVDQLGGHGRAHHWTKMKLYARVSRAAPIGWFVVIFIAWRIPPLQPTDGGLRWRARNPPYGFSMPYAPPNMHAPQHRQFHIMKCSSIS
jgi:hypothetical protein